MTISKRLGIGYTIMAAVCLSMLAVLWHHEFVTGPAEFAARGLTDVHQDTAIEVFAVCFLGLVPVLLAVGWWWTQRVLKPLRALTLVAGKMESDTLHLPLPRGVSDDEVDRLSKVFAAMTARLDASFRQIREFTLHASHELKTPLTVMRAELETALRESRPRSPRETEWMESLLDEVQRLAAIVDSLTLLSKADAGLVQLKREAVTFGELVRESFEDALILAQPKELRVTLDSCADAELVGDRHRLRQLLVILLDNAVKYNRPGGELRLSLREVDGAAELQVANDGGGLTPNLQRRAFGRFVRGENAIGRVEGCGLGLNIAQWIVQAHGGTIELRSAGERTTAVVRLPLAIDGREPVVDGAALALKPAVVH